MCLEDWFFVTDDVPVLQSWWVRMINEIRVLSFEVFEV